MTSGWRVVAVIGGLLPLAACAPRLQDPWGLALSRGEAVELPSMPDSLQVDVGIQPRDHGSLPFSARLYAKPHRSYRLDAFGFPSVIAASYLWKDDHWMFVRHDKKQVLEGTGNHLELEDSPLRLPDVHAVLGFLWGRPLPGFLEQDTGTAGDTLLPPGPEGQVRWTYRGEVWEARFDPLTGLCLEASSVSLRIRYGLHERRGARVLPGEAEVFADGAPSVVLRVQEWTASPVWRKDPFLLVPPAAYKRP